jgi:hypothetical protein
MTNGEDNEKTNETEQSETKIEKQKKQKQVPSDIDAEAAVGGWTEQVVEEVSVNPEPLIPLEIKEKIEKSVVEQPVKEKLVEPNKADFDIVLWRRLGRKIPLPK